MSKFITLLKASMSGGVQFFNYRGKTDRSRKLMPIILGTFIGGLMFLSAKGMLDEVIEEGAGVAILTIYTLITAIIIITEGTYKSIDLLFKPKDNDTLLAMPIRKSTIVAVRITKFYIFELLYSLLFLLPAILAYATKSEVGMSYFLVAGTMLLLVPIIPIAISCIFGLITSLFSARFKRRTALQVIMSFIVMLGFAVMVLAMNTVSEIDGNSLVAAGNKIAELYYPAGVFRDLVTSFSLWQYLLFVGVNLLVAVVTVFLISRFYFQTITKLSIVRRQNNANVKFSFTKRSQTATMVHKELNRYFNTPVLLTNTAMGLVLFMVAVVVLCLNFESIVQSTISPLEGFPLSVEQIRSYLPSIAYGLVAFASLMTFITASMISLEGKAFNALKALPISGKKVIMTKVLTAMLLIVPITMLGYLIMAIRFQFGIIETLLGLIGVVVIPLVTELIGILIDLKFARFDAENDAVVVKQSAGVMTATFLGLGMVLVTISILFAAVFFSGQITGLIMMDATFGIVALFLYFAVTMRGEEKYMKLNA